MGIRPLAQFKHWITSPTRYPLATASDILNFLFCPHKFLPVGIIFFLFYSFSFVQATGEGAMSGDGWKNAKSIYEFTAKDIDGNDVSLEKYK